MNTEIIFDSLDILCGYLHSSKCMYRLIFNYYNNHKLLSKFLKLTKQQEDFEESKFNLNCFFNLCKNEINGIEIEYNLSLAILEVDFILDLNLDFDKVEYLYYDYNFKFWGENTLEKFTNLKILRCCIDNKLKNFIFPSKLVSIELFETDIKLFSNYNKNIKYLTLVKRKGEYN